MASIPSTVPEEVPETKVICSVVIKAFDDRLDLLSDAAKGCIEDLSKKLFAKKLISGPVKNAPTKSFDSFLNDFKPNIKLASREQTQHSLRDLVTKVEGFLTAMEETGGPLETAAIAIREDINKKLGGSSPFGTNSKIMPNPGNQSFPSLSTHRNTFGHTPFNKTSPAGMRSFVTDHDTGISELQDSRSNIETDSDMYDVPPQGVQGGTHSDISPLHFATHNGSLVSRDPQHPMVVPSQTSMNGIVNSNNPAPTSLQLPSTQASNNDQKYIQQKDSPIDPPSSVQETHSNDDASQMPSTTGEPSQPHIDRRKSSGGRSNNIQGTNPVPPTAYKHHSSYPIGYNDDAARLEKLRRRHIEEQDLKISKLKEELQQIQQEKDAMRQEIDTMRQAEMEKMKRDRQELENKEKRLNEREAEIDSDRKTLRNKHRKMEEEWQEKQDKVNKKLSDEQRSLEEKCTKKEKELEKRCDEKGRDLEKKYDEKEKKLERRYKQLHKNLEREHTRKLNIEKQEPQSSNSLKGKFQPKKEKDEEWLSEEKKKLADIKAGLEKKTKRVNEILQRENELKTFKVKLDEKEEDIRRENNSLTDRKTDFNTETSQEEERIRKLKEELLLKRRRFWDEQKEATKLLEEREKEFNRREREAVNQNLKSMKSKKELCYVTLIVTMLLILLFVLIYSYITSS